MSDGMVLKVSAAEESAVLWDIKHILDDHPGDLPVTINSGMRMLTLGQAWNCDGSPEVRAKLSEFGEIISG